MLAESTPNFLGLRTSAGGCIVGQHAVVFGKGAFHRQLVDHCHSGCVSGGNASESHRNRQRCPQTRKSQPPQIIISFSSQSPPFSKTAVFGPSRYFLLENEHTISDWFVTLIPQSNIPPKKQPGGSHMENMFCYQCEQTAGCSGCTGLSRRMRKDGRCCNLQDALTGALIGLARATERNAQPTKDTWHLMASALFATLTNVNFSAEDIETFTAASTKKHAVWSRTAAAARAPGAQRRLRHAEALVGAGGHPQPQNRSFSSACAAWLTPTTPMCWAMRMKRQPLFAKALFAVGEDWGMEALCRSCWRSVKKRILRAWRCWIGQTPKRSAIPCRRRCR